MAALCFVPFVLRLERKVWLAGGALIVGATLVSQLPQLLRPRRELDRKRRGAGLAYCESGFHVWAAWSLFPAP